MGPLMAGGLVGRLSIRSPREFNGALELRLGRGAAAPMTPRTPQVAADPGDITGHIHVAQLQSAEANVGGDGRQRMLLQDHTGWCEHGDSWSRSAPAPPGPNPTTCPQYIPLRIDGHPIDA